MTALALLCTAVWLGVHWQCARAELATAQARALRSLFAECGGAHWSDVRGWPYGEPCQCTGNASVAESLWTGVRCDATCHDVVALCVRIAAAGFGSGG